MTYGMGLLMVLLTSMTPATAQPAAKGSTGTVAATHAAPAPVAQTPDRENDMAEDKHVPSTKTKKIGVVIFDDFETLDVYGPVQMWGRLPDHELVFVSEDGRPVRSSQGLSTSSSVSFETAPQFAILLVPGGFGTRVQVHNAAMLDFLKRQSAGAEWTTSVCTGAALLARAGLLDGRRATTNKIAFAWATSQSDRVDWQRRARWVTDGKFVTSSGVSAGTDMALALVQTIYGRPMADSIARAAEYQWNDQPGTDPFALEDDQAKR